MSSRHRDHGADRPDGIQKTQYQFPRSGVRRTLSLTQIGWLGWHGCKRSARHVIALLGGI